MVSKLYAASICRSHAASASASSDPTAPARPRTIEILEGILAPSDGEVRVLGSEWGADDNALRERIGVTLQETRLSEKLTVRETLRLFRSFYSQGFDPDECIEMVSLGEKADTRLGKLSGGQKQRVSVACGLVGDPELLFLDEPSTGLDPASRREVWEIVRRFRDRSHTVLLTTHYMEEAERLCDRVAVVDHGRIIALGTPAELIASLGAEHVIEISCAEPYADLEHVLTDVETVSSVTVVGGVDATLTVDAPHRALPSLLEGLRHRGVELTRVATRQASLDDVFVQLTGRRLGGEEKGD